MFAFSVVLKVFHNDKRRACADMMAVVVGVVVGVVVVVEVAFEEVEQVQVLERFAVGAVGSSVESAHLAAAAAVAVAVVLAEGLPVAQQVPTLRLAQHTSFYQFVVV